MNPQCAYMVAAAQALVSLFLQSLDIGRAAGKEARKGEVCNRLLAENG